MMIDDTVGSMVDLNLSLVNGDLVCVAKDRSNFFQRQEPSVRESEEHNEAANESEEDEEQIELPTHSPGMVSKMYSFQERRPDLHEGCGRCLSKANVAKRQHGDCKAVAF